jgi:NADH-quinone oxidoreductase subunit H
MLALQAAVAYLVFVERKIAAYMQDRIGPNRVGPRGLLQPVADGLKFLFKEEIIPDHVDKVLFLLAPAIVLAAATLAFAVIPFGYVLPWWGGEPIELVIAPNVDIGLVYLFAIGSLAVYGVILGGWASNNKYSFLGAMRSSAQVISYEVPLGLSVLGVVLLSGSLRLDNIIEGQAQAGTWNVVVQPLGLFLFLASAFAEAGRLPFDLQEAEQELIGGYHTEYTGMKFGMFALGEYTHMISASFLTVILFLGGWHLWGVTPYTPGSEVTLLGALLRIAVFGLKVFVMIFVFMWIRWSWPRFRFDQLMSIAWCSLVPLALANLVLTAFVTHYALPAWRLTAGSIAVLVGTMLIVARGGRKSEVRGQLPAAGGP